MTPRARTKKKASTNASNTKKRSPIKRRSTAKKRVLLMGPGTVGSPTWMFARSMGYAVDVVKYDGAKRDKITKEYIIDPDTKEPVPDFNSIRFRGLRERFDPEGDTRVYIARGSNKDERKAQVTKNVGRCDGVIDEDADFDEYCVAIDCTDSKDDRNFKEIYKKFGIPFAINGGGLDGIVRDLFWASGPNLSIINRIERYRTKNTKIVSCNSHAITTLMGIVTGMFKDGDAFRNSLRDTIYTIMDRRFQDEGKATIADAPMGPAIEDDRDKPYGMHHGKEIYSLLPHLYNSLQSRKAKWPTQNFHTCEMIMDFKEKVTPTFVEDLREKLSEYPRVILNRGEILSHERSINALDVAHLPRGNFPMPVVRVLPVGTYKLSILWLTPQEDIVTPSAIDWLNLRFHPRLKTWEDTFNLTNKRGLYYGYSLEHVKHSGEDNLINYKDQVLDVLAARTPG